MDGARLAHGEAERYLDTVQVGLVTRAEVDRVLVGSGQARADVKRVLGNIFKYGQTLCIKKPRMKRLKTEPKRKHKY